MRIAIAYDGFPWPPRSGDNTRIDQLIQVLRGHGHQVFLICTALPPPESRRYSSGKVDRIYFYYPRTMRNRLRLIKRGLDAWLSKLGLPTVETILLRLMNRKARFSEVMDYWHRFPEGLDDFVRKLSARRNIDLVIVEYVWLYKTIDSLPEHVRTAIDVHDIQYRRVEEFRKIGKTFPLDIDRNREMGIYSRFDAAISIQYSETEELLRALPETRVITAGMATYQPRPLLSQDEPVVLFLGGYNEANAHGIRRFLTEVWPEVIQRIPGARMRIAGHVCRAVNAGCSLKSVDLLGYVEDHGNLYDAADVIVNPLWAGTGLKIKTVEAIGYAKPLVTTSVGVEGMLPSPFEACVVRDDPKSMAKALSHLLANQDERQALAEKAEKYAEKHLSVDSVFAELLEWIGH